VVPDEAKILKSEAEAVTVSAVAILISVALLERRSRTGFRTVVNFDFLNPGYLGSRQFFSGGLQLRNMGMQLRCKHCDRSFSPLFCGGSKQTAKSFKTCQKSRK